MMNNLKLRNIFIGLAVILSTIMAFFPSSSFIGTDHFAVLGNVKQQNYNTVGLFEISPLKATKFYYYQSALCTWIDLRSATVYKADHLSFTVNMKMESLKNAQWDADRILLIIGENDHQVKDAVALLRQVKNIRAFGIMGGYEYARHVLSEPLGFDLEAKYSDQQLSDLQLYREKITGEKSKPVESQRKITTRQSMATDEGC